MADEMQVTLDLSVMANRTGHGVPAPRARAFAAWRLAGGALIALIAGGAAVAQGVATVSQPVVQPLPGHGAPTLDAALSRLGRNPGDVDALVAAGVAALGTGDAAAAVGFYTRADAISRGNPRIVAGLAGAKVLADDPLGALPLFDTLAPGAAIPAERISDRGLAYDLVGDNVTAQTYYLQALAAGAGDEARRRLAISLAITGDARDSGAAIAPLLQRQDRASWRARAFSLAIVGQEEDAVAIAKSIMPADLANGMAPYLRYMQRLTRAQQAAAANLGQFPLPSAIGNEDPRIAAWQQSHGVQRLAGIDTGLAPTGAPLGVAPAGPGAAAVAAYEAHKRHRGEMAQPVTPAMLDAVPEPKPSRETSVPGLAQVLGRDTAPVRPAVAPSVYAPSPVPSQSAPVAVAPRPAPVKRPSFTDAFASFGAPDVAPQVTVGAVDVRALVAPAPLAKPVRAPLKTDTAKADAATVAPTPDADSGAGVAKSSHGRKAELAAAKDKSAGEKAGKDKAGSDKTGNDKAASDKPDSASDTGEAASKTKGRRKSTDAKSAEAKPKPPAHPSRIWVQVGVGRHADRVAYDWRKLNRDEGKLFNGKSASIANWGRTNRVLVGPFDSQDAADAYAEKLKKGGHADAFVWVSPEGQAVDPVVGQDGQ